MKKKLLQVRYMLMTTKSLLILSNTEDEYHNSIIGTVLSNRHPDDDEFEEICNSIHEEIEEEQIGQVDISDILTSLN
jgi:hypothetical protein